MGYITQYAAYCVAMDAMEKWARRQGRGASLLLGSYSVTRALDARMGAHEYFTLPQAKAMGRCVLKAVLRRFNSYKTKGA